MSSDATLRENIAQLDRLADTLYNSHDPEKRSHAEAALRGFSSSPDFIPQCSLILDNSTSPFALHLASSSLFKLFTQFNSTFSSSQIVDISAISFFTCSCWRHFKELFFYAGNYVLNYLARRLPTLPSFVTKSLVQLLCRITKLSWNDNLAHREIFAEVSKFFQSTSQHYLLGVEIFKELVLDMNTPTPYVNIYYSVVRFRVFNIFLFRHQSVTLHRKIAISFRDLSLLSIFQHSISTLQKLHGHQLGFSSGSLSFCYFSLSPNLTRQDVLVSADQENILSSTFELNLRCLGFDFIGSNVLCSMFVCMRISFIFIPFDLQVPI
jgi:exportin-7